MPSFYFDVEKTVIYDCFLRFKHKKLTHFVISLLELSYINNSYRILLIGTARKTTYNSENKKMLY